LEIIRACFDFSAAAVFSGFLSLLSPCEGGIAVPMASKVKTGAKRTKKSKRGKFKTSSYACPQ
jgi:hypothetical protein